MTKREKKRMLADLRAVRGAERRAHFEAGGSLNDWRGGLHLTTRNKKRYNRKANKRGVIAGRQSAI